MPGIQINKAFKVIRGAKAFINLECGLTRGTVPNPRRQIQDQAQNLKDAKRRISTQRQKLREKDEEIARLKKLSEEDGKAGGARGRRGGSRSAGDSGKLPDYLIIGAQKGGTTTLHSILEEHPHVVPATLKEVHYFDSRKFEQRGMGWYRTHFPRLEREDGRTLITGEASPYYLYHPLVPRRAARELPEVKLIALLRNPVDRAYSDYQHRLSDGIETLSFEGAIEAEAERIRGEKEKMFADESYVSRNLRRYAYLDRGVYVDQLREWHEFFGEEQLLVLKSEDLFKRTAETVERVLDFLGLSAWEREAFGKGKNRRSYEPMSPRTRERLEAFFEPHNQRLYDYLGRDFGW